ncbi:outer membrane protein [Megasphaera elsdenii CAG:570]|uniref:Outer membrane protein n=1 Tax=Megasphaera elsdenii CAG:570 TaxID=1263087 RepID=R7MWL3_MEGEL|nr:outer membrane protein [Megasphaera elsdenii CAG:570]
MKAAKSGLTGYETAEELAAIAAGKSPAEVQQETAEAVHKENEILNPAPVDTTPQITGDKISYMSGTSDMQFDTSVPGYPMAVIQPGQDVSLPYGEAVSDADLKPYVDKVATAVTVGPVPEAQRARRSRPGSPD